MSGRFCQWSANRLSSVAEKIWGVRATKLICSSFVLGYVECELITEKYG